MSIYCCKDLEYKCKDFDNCEVVKVEEPLDSRILLCYDGGSFEKVVYSRSRVVGRLSGQLSRLKTLKRDLARFNVDLEETP